MGKGGDMVWGYWLEISEDVAREFKRDDVQETVLIGLKFVVDISWHSRVPCLW